MVCVVCAVCAVCVCVSALIRQCWHQEVGCGFGAVSQEAADCITGGTDGGERRERWIRGAKDVNKERRRRRNGKSWN